MNVLKNSLFLLAATMSFAACSDDEPEANGYDEDKEDVVEWVRPTEDVIQNYIGHRAVVYGQFDEVTERVIARINSPRIGNTARTEFIPEDAELVIMDNNTLLSLSKEQIDVLHDAYQRGTICYLHKPNAFGAALFYAAMEQGSDALFAPSMSQSRANDDDSWLYPYDVVMMQKEKGFYQLADVHSAEPDTFTSVVEEIDDETGNPISRNEKEILCYQTAPNAYEYGRLAESVADWINTPAETKSAKTRAEDNHALDEVPGQIDIPTQFHNLRNDSYTVLSKPLRLYYWISNLYNFDEDQDYYHIVLQEEYDASEGYKGRYAVKGNTWGAYDTKYMGQAYNGPHIYAYFRQEDKYGLLRQWNEQPMNDGKVTNTETVQGWSIGASVGYGSGFVGSLNATYNNQTTVSTLEKEMKVSFRKDQTYDNGLDWNTAKAMEWEYDYGAESCMSFTSGPQPKVKDRPAGDALCRNLSRPMQSWNWVIADTKKKNATDLSINIALTMPMVHRVGKPTGGKVKQTNEIYNITERHAIQLPIPNRYMHTYSLDHGTIANPTEWNSIYPILLQGSSNFSKLSNKEARCGKSESAMEKAISAKWNQVGNELANLKLPNLENTYRIRLKDENNRTYGKTLVIDNGSIRME